MKTRFTTLLVAAAIGGFPISQAQAHYVWIESDGTHARIQFGGLGENLRETSPGRLDNIVPTTAVVVASSGQKPLILTTTTNALVGNVTAGPGESIVFDASRRPIGVKTVDGVTTRTASIRSARYVSDFSAQTAQLTLDVIPTGRTMGSKVEFRVVFRNAPAPKMKLTLEAASGWEHSAETDEQGLVFVDLPWKGRYVIDARHVEAVAGTRDGHAYDKADFRTTLSFARATGLESPPPPPALTPKPIG